MSYKVEFSAEFDQHGYPPTTGRIEIRIDDEWPAQQTLVLVLADEEVLLMTIARDQWGVWYSVMNAQIEKDGKLNHYLQSTTIAQEDCTRSFLGALISALMQLKHENECECPQSTITKTNNPDIRFKE